MINFPEDILKYEITKYLDHRSYKMYTSSCVKIYKLYSDTINLDKLKYELMIENTWFIRINENESSTKYYNRVKQMNLHIRWNQIQNIYSDSNEDKLFKMKFNFWLDKNTIKHKDTKLNKYIYKIYGNLNNEIYCWHRKRMKKNIILYNR